MSFDYDTRVTQSGINDSIRNNELSVPTFKYSAFSSAAEAFSSIPRLPFQAYNHFTGSNVDVPFQHFLDTANNAIEETPYMGYSQKTVDFLSGVAGFAANPINWWLGESAVAGIGSAAARVAPIVPEAVTAIGRAPVANLIGEGAAKFVSGKTVNEVGARAAQSLGVGLATGAPMAFADSYNSNTRKFDIQGAVDQTVAFGGLALAIDVVAPAIGHVFGKIRNVSRGEKLDVPIHGAGTKADYEEIKKAYDDGRISISERDYAENYLNGKQTYNELKKPATDILQNSDYKVDSATGKIHMELMDKDIINNVRGMQLDQVASGIQGDLKTAGSDFMQAHLLDVFKSNNSIMTNGIKGYLSFMEKRLAQEETNFAQLEKAMKKEKFEHFNHDHPMSEKSLYKILKANDLDSQKIPHNLTKEVRERIKLEKKVAKLKESISKTKKKAKLKPELEIKLGEQKEELGNIKSQIKKFRPTKKEISQLEEHFLGGDLPENFMHTEEYHRLQDLAEVSEKAAGLYHMVNLKNEYAMQKSYHDLMGLLMSVMESDVKRYSDLDNLVKYSEHRAEAAMPKDKADGDLIAPEQMRVEGTRQAFDTAESREQIAERERISNEEVSADDQTIDDNETSIKKADSKDLNKDFKTNRKKYEQFRSIEKELAECIIG
jgi:hypothetical protein